MLMTLSFLAMPFTILVVWLAKVQKEKKFWVYFIVSMSWYIFYFGVAFSIYGKTGDFPNALSPFVLILALTYFGLGVRFLYLRTQFSKGCIYRIRSSEFDILWAMFWVSNALAFVGHYMF